MSSGENAKPPATFEERNPFDISRNSGPQVAAEIAKRMAAWKQARARIGSAPTPSQSITNQSGTVQPGDPKQPPIAAPVQPARMPKAAPGSQPAQTPSALASANSADPRVPYFAVSATRRAMPPAPSPKQARPPLSRDDERAARTDQPAIVTSPPDEQSLPDRDERPVQADTAVLAVPQEPPVAEPSPADSAAIEEAPLASPAESAAVPPESSGTHPFESAFAVEPSAPARPEPAETERRRAEARALKARWLAAHDLDTLLERPAAGGAPSDEPAGTVSGDAGMVSARDAGTGDDAGLLVHEPQDAESNLDRSSMEELASAVEATADDPAPVAALTAEPEVTAEHMTPSAALDQAAVGNDPIRKAPKAPVPETASVAERDAGREARDIATLDEIAGRREPTFDLPIAHAASATRETPVLETAVDAPDEAIVPPRSAPVAAEAPDRATASRDATDDRHLLSIAALDAAAGRKEPTFDPPVQPAASDRTVPDATTEARTPIRPEEPAPTVSASAESAAVPPAHDMEALEEAAGRKEPTFDEPARSASAAARQKPAPPVGLRPIETRIEARRVDTLRADPPLTARRPIFPHIEPEEWDVPPPIAAHARQERSGTGWAIGLGSLLLIAGITAPAAIWQQGRQVQDQVALTPAPVTQRAEATPDSPAIGSTTAAPQIETPAQAALPAAPQTGTTPSAAAPPAAAAPQSPAPGEERETDQAQDALPATTLNEIARSEEVNEAPIVPPQPPTVDLRTASTATPMVARPFVPEEGNGPFLRAPTTGAASVPVAGAPAQSGVGVKPNLIGQLKPKAAVASASKPVARKPVSRKAKPFFQQSPDQMFETLIETLSEGKPVNPNTKPASPSTRR